MKQHGTFRLISHLLIMLVLLAAAMSFENQSEHFENFDEDDVIFYSVLYSVVTVVFAMAVLSKFLTNELRMGFRSVLSLLVLFLGEPLCQFLIKGPGGVLTFAGCCLFIYSILPASHLPVGNKTVLVTGTNNTYLLKFYNHSYDFFLNALKIQILSILNQCLHACRYVFMT